MDAKVSANPSWWQEHGATGYLDPNRLIPDPFQPRKFIVEVEMDELTKSVENSGIREPLTVSPVAKMPWLKIESATIGDFVIVSGHRRQLAALRAQLTEVPVLIRIYKNEIEHREDAALLNAQRSSLTPLEEAWEILRRKQIGEDIEHIALSFGKSIGWARNRLALTELDPDIQARLNPNLGEDMLSITVAADLGSVAIPSRKSFEIFLEDRGLDLDIPDESEKQLVKFAYQRALLMVIEDQKMSSVQAREFINHSRHSHGAMYRNSRGDHRKPHKSLEIFKNYLKSIEKSIVMGWGESEFSNMMRLLELEVAEDLVRKFKSTYAQLEILSKRLEGAIGRKRQRSTYSTPLITSSPRKIREVRQVSAEHRLQKSVPAPGGKQIKFSCFANYFDSTVGRYVSGEITDPWKYIELWKKNDFKWQAEGKSKPSHMPNLEEVMALCQ